LEFARSQMIRPFSTAGFISLRQWTWRRCALPAMPVPPDFALHPRVPCRRPRRRRTSWAWIACPRLLTSFPYRRRRCAGCPAAGPMVFHGMSQRRDLRCVRAAANHTGVACSDLERDAAARPLDLVAALSSAVSSDAASSCSVSSCGVAASCVACMHNVIHSL